jgi:hypothetical protein
MVAIQCRLQEKHGAHYVWPVREQVKPWRRHRQASFEDYLKVRRQEDITPKSSRARGRRDGRWAREIGPKGGVMYDSRSFIVSSFFARSGVRTYL